MMTPSALLVIPSRLHFLHKYLKWVCSGPTMKSKTSGKGSGTFTRVVDARDWVVNKTFLHQHFFSYIVPREMRQMWQLPKPINADVLGWICIMVEGSSAVYLTEGRKELNEIFACMTSQPAAEETFSSPINISRILFLIIYDSTSVGTLEYSDESLLSSGSSTAPYKLSCHPFSWRFSFCLFFSKKTLKTRFPSRHWESSTRGSRGCFLHSCLDRLSRYNVLSMCTGKEPTFSLFSTSLCNHGEALENKLCLHLPPPVLLSQHVGRRRKVWSEIGEEEFTRRGVGARTDSIRIRMKTFRISSRTQAHLVFTWKPVRLIEE